MLFDPLRRSLLALTLAGCVLASLPAGAQSAPAGGKWRDCHGYVRHVSDTNIRVHCIDGVPADLSFLYAPNYEALFSNGKSLQAKDLQPGTPVGASRITVPNTANDAAPWVSRNAARSAMRDSACARETLGMREATRPP